jgi:hypothetical protein
MFNKYSNIKIIFLMSALATMSFSSYANDWVMENKENKHCTLIGAILDKKSGERIAYFGLVKASNLIDEKEAFLLNSILMSDTGLLMQNIRQFEVERGVGVNITSKTMSEYMDFVPSNDYKNKPSILYTASARVRDNVVAVLSNNEDITFEFNTSTQSVIKGIISAKDFAKDYVKFKSCTEELN